MEVNRRRRTDPWVWVAIAAILAIVLFFIIWSVTTNSLEEAQRERTQREQAAEKPKPQPMPQQPQQTQQPSESQGSKVVIRDQERIREIVRVKPVYIYEEPPQANTTAPRSVVVVPQDAQVPSSGYEKVDVPAMFTLNGMDYIIQAGVPEQGDQTEFISTGKQADGHTIYYKKGTVEPRNTLYLKLQPNSNTYIPYELSP
ncbi:MAG: hypothetical protein ABFD64_09715 [Armatimonadota bacterium]